MDEGESLYGTNAITGSADDAAALRGAEADIMVSSTQTITVGENPEEPVKGEETKESTAESADAVLEAEIAGATKADADVRTDLTAKGIDFTALETEYENDGTLSSDSLKALEAAGYPKSVVDAYIKGMAATAEKFTNAVYDFAGGKAEFEALTKHVQAMGLPQVKAFNTVVQTGDLTQIRMVLDGFKASMEAKNGKAPSRVILGEGFRPGNVAQGYAAKADMVAAMSDARYARDPAYTREVERKTMLSTFL